LFNKLGSVPIKILFIAVVDEQVCPGFDWNDVSVVIYGA
jgi:hypothetical protein